MKKKIPKAVQPLTETPEAGATAPPSETARSIEKRWTKRLAKPFTPVSVFFLENYATLRPFPLTHGEAMAVIHLMKHKWDERPPHIGFTRLAQEMGVSVGQARTIVRGLDRKKLLRREKRVGQTNMFHLEPLFEVLHAAMDEQAAKPHRKAVRR
jgi:hypothetical protein